MKFFFVRILMRPNNQYIYIFHLEIIYGFWFLTHFSHFEWLNVRFSVKFFYHWIHWNMENPLVLGTKIFADFFTISYLLKIIIEIRTKKHFIPCALTYFTSFSGQNSYPPPYKDRIESLYWFFETMNLNVTSSTIFCLKPHFCNKIWFLKLFEK